ncbi:MAG: hypothetical protein HDR17_07360 [Lachnospiraceae bacterium]|nr:hypothetical protein [Lachnospiraceae bacterium]
MQIYNIRLLIINMIESFFTSWAFMKAGRMEPGNILVGVIFLLSLFLYRRINIRLTAKPFVNTRATRGTALILSALFSIFYMAVDYPRYIELLTNRLFQVLVLTAVFLGFFICFYKVLLLLFSYSGDKEALNRILYRPEESSGIRHFPLYCFLGCLICWFPYFLYQYPGIMTPDSINQLEQVLGLIGYSNHHPFVHTMIFSLFYHIGFFISGDMVAAVSLYTFFQMCFLAFSIFYLEQTLEMFRIRWEIMAAVTLFYALVPYHAVFSVTVWKDIPFAAVVLLFSCSLLRMTRRIEARTLTMFVGSGVMVSLLRSNGWYGFLFCVPFLLYYYRRQFKVMFPTIAGILLASVIVKYPVMNALDVTQPDLIESLAIPTQQIAAVLCNDRQLTDEQRTLVEHVIDTTYIKELYHPNFADNMKELVRAGDQEYLAEHKWEYFKLWVELGCSYPEDYAKAYVQQTYGYWYPDSFYPVAEGEGVSATSLGVSHTPLIGGPIVIKAKEIALKLGGMVPIYGMLWSMGFAFYFLLFCIGNTFVRQEKSKLICYLPSFALYLTVMIATPVATDFRYVYFMVFSLPFYLMTTIISVHQ